MDYNKAKELLKLQQEAQKIKNELSNIHIEAEVDGVVAERQMHAFVAQVAGLDSDTPGQLALNVEVPLIRVSGLHGVEERGRDTIAQIGGGPTFRSQWQIERVDTAGEGVR